MFVTFILGNKEVKMLLLRVKYYRKIRWTLDTQQLVNTLQMVTKSQYLLMKLDQTSLYIFW